MKKVRLILSILLLAVSSSYVFAQTKPQNPTQNLPHCATQRLAERNDAEGPLSRSVWGFLAVKVNGDTLVKLNSGRRMVPASNLKLVTTGAALLALGGDYRYSTVFATDGEIRDSVLAGNLFIIGRGDPMLGELFPYLPGPDETFGKWSKALSDMGIRKIEGDVRGDGSWFAAPQYHPDWNVEDIETRDGVVPSGLTWRGRMGDSIPDGPASAALRFRQWLEANGMAAPRQQATDGPAPAPAQPANLDSLTVLATIESLPLKDLIRIANCQSDNFIAETLLKTLGKLRGDGDGYAESVMALRKSLAPLGLMAASGQMRFADGSGLSRKNYVSPEFLVSYLRAMYRSREGKTFLASLPFAGEPKTTLENRLPKRPYALRHRIRMKSGSMDGVRCFSGYILPSDGKPGNTIVFSILTNNAVAPGSQVYPLIDAMIESLANEN